MTSEVQYQTHSAARQNLYRLSSIRAVALLGQIVALIYFTLVSPIGLPAAIIALVLAIYASVTVATWQRSRMQVPITDNEFFIHLLIDILFFSLLLYFSGGASNPFISYYLIPISIAAITLSRRSSITCRAGGHDRLQPIVEILYCRSQPLPPATIRLLAITVCIF